MDYTFPIPEEMENEFLSLVNNTSMKMYSNKKKTYQISGQRYLHNIQNRPKKCMRILLLLSSIYLCGKGFSTLLNIKSKARNKLKAE